MENFTLYILPPLRSCKIKIVSPKAYGKHNIHYQTTRFEYKCNNRGTHHPSESCAFTSQPNLTKNLTMSIWPAHMALCSAVIPSSLAALGSPTCNTQNERFSNYDTVVLTIDVEVHNTSRRLIVKLKINYTISLVLDAFIRRILKTRIIASGLK